MRAIALTSKGPVSRRRRQLSVTKWHYDGGQSREFSEMLAGAIPYDFAESSKGLTDSTHVMNFGGLLRKIDDFSDVDLE